MHPLAKRGLTILVVAPTLISAMMTRPTLCMLAFFLTFVGMIEWTAMKRHLKVALLLPSSADQVSEYATPVAQSNLFIILKCLACSLTSLAAYFGLGMFNFSLGCYFIFWVTLTLIGSNNAEKKAVKAKKSMGNTPNTTPRDDPATIFDQHEKAVQATKYTAELFLNFCFEYFGFVWITGVSYAVLLDRSGPQGHVLALIVIIANWANDIVALLVGRTLKGHTHPLHPRISPNKSAEGAIAGTIANGFAWPMLLALLGTEDMYWGQDIIPTFPLFFALGIVFGIVGVVGDLLQSLFKRTARIKDTGTFFPGHGGVLDRMDGLLLCYPVCWWLFWLFTRLVELPGHNIE